MDKGVKNLNAVARTASKRGIGTDEGDDSGIGLEETENEVAQDRVDDSGSASDSHAMEYGAHPPSEPRLPRLSSCPIASMLSPPMPTRL